MIGIHVFKIPKEHKFCVHIYDISQAEGWSADYAGNVHCLESKLRLPLYSENICSNLIITECNKIAD